MTDLTIPAEAVEAASNAIHRALASDWMAVANALAASDDDVSDAYPRLLHDLARAALTAALPILHPTIPNTVEALGALPLRSVAQGVDDDGDVVLIFHDDLGDWGCLGDGEAYPTAQAVALAENLGITEWTVLWPLGGAA